MTQKKRNIYIYTLTYFVGGFLISCCWDYDDKIVYLIAVLRCNITNLLTSNHCRWDAWIAHYNDDIMSGMASQITSLTIAYSSVYSGADQRKHQSSASLTLVRGIHQWPLNSPHKGPVTRKMFPFWWRHHGLMCARAVCAKHSLMNRFN